MEADWKIECETYGPHGYVFYIEGAQSIPFYWEFGGGNVVAIVRIEEPDRFDLRFPWAMDRKREILERTAAELIRQKAPTCHAEIDVKALCILLLEPPKK